MWLFKKKDAGPKMSWALKTIFVDEHGDFIKIYDYKKLDIPKKTFFQINQHVNKRKFITT